MDTPGSRARRLRVVGKQPNPTIDAAAMPDGVVTARRAVAFAALVANGNTSTVEDTLQQMTAEQLHALAIALATQVNTAGTMDVRGEVADVGPEGVCAIAIALSAQSFGTTPEAVLSADRHRTVTDARAVAMTAARRAGLTLPAIAATFGKDHTSVMYAQSKVTNTPRLDAVCARVAEQLEAHFAKPISVPGPEEQPDSAGSPSTTLQLAALDQGQEDTVRHSQADDRQRVAISTTPGSGR